MFYDFSIRYLVSYVVWYNNNKQGS